MKVSGRSQSPKSPALPQRKKKVHKGSHKFSTQSSLKQLSNPSPLPGFLPTTFNKRWKKAEAENLGSSLLEEVPCERKEERENGSLLDSKMTWRGTDWFADSQLV